MVGLPCLPIISIVLMSCILGVSSFFIVQPIEMMMRKEQLRLTMSTTTTTTIDNHIQNDSNNADDNDVTPHTPILDDPTTVSSNVFRQDERPIVLFDGVCNMCNSAVNLALDWDPQGKLRFSALQSNVGRSLLEANGRSADDISSIVLITRDGAYIKSDAVLKITEELTPTILLPLKPAAVLSRFVVPQFLRDLIYDGVADNRYDIMGKKDECRFDSDGEFDDRFVDDDIAFQNQYRCKCLYFVNILKSDIRSIVLYMSFGFE